MIRKPRSNPDPIERAIALALHPAEFIPDHAGARTTLLKA